jgi:hypothetical protein
MTEPDIPPHRWPISIEFRGRTTEGWYCIDDGGGGVSVHHVNSAGVKRRGWAEIRYYNWESMARTVLRELAEENERHNGNILSLVKGSKAWKILSKIEGAQSVEIAWEHRQEGD